MKSEIALIKMRNAPYINETHLNSDLIIFPILVFVEILIKLWVSYKVEAIQIKQEL